MTRKRYVIATSGSVVMASLFLSGTVVTNASASILVGFMWILAAAFWFGECFKSKRRATSRGFMEEM